MDKYAIVTGASRGIGAALATELARRGNNIVLIARSKQRLQSLTSVLQLNYNVKVLYLSLDLSTISAPAVLEDWCRSKGIVIHILINNAGFAHWGWFDELTWEKQLGILQVNINCITELTYRMIPFLLKNKRSYILNVGSTIGYQATPTLSIYSASKSYILALSRSLRREFLPIGIVISCLIPGPTTSNFMKYAGMQSLTKIAANFEMSSENVARIGLNGMFKGKIEIVPGLFNILHRFLAYIIPRSLMEKIGSRIYLKRIAPRKKDKNIDFEGRF